MEHFIELMAETMEIDKEGIDENTIFREACEFDSMIGFSMICMLEEDFNTTITVDQFLACKTIGELFALVEEK